MTVFSESLTSLFLLFNWPSLLSSFCFRIEVEAKVGGAVFGCDSGRRRRRPGKRRQNLCQHVLVLQCVEEQSILNVRVHGVFKLVMNADGGIDQVNRVLDA